MKTPLALIAVIILAGCAGQNVALEPADADPDLPHQPDRIRETRTVDEVLVDAAKSARSARVGRSIEDARILERWLRLDEDFDRFIAALRASAHDPDSIKITWFSEPQQMSQEEATKVNQYPWAWRGQEWVNFREGAHQMHVRFSGTNLYGGRVEGFGVAYFQEDRPVYLERFTQQAGARDALKR